MTWLLNCPLGVVVIRLRLTLLAIACCAATSIASGQELPPRTTLEARLSRATGSRISHTGDPIEATVIAPLSVDGCIVVPQGSRLTGSVTTATAIGLGLKHSTASIGFGFRTLHLPSGSAIPITGQIIEIELAKEQIDGAGIVHGMHPIASVSSGVLYGAVSLLLVNPAIGAPFWGVKSVIAPSANPEIRFPQGTEIVVQLATAVALPASKAEFDVPGSFSTVDLKGHEPTGSRAPPPFAMILSA